MKKLIAGLAASFMLAAGLVTVSGSVSPASAACVPSSGKYTQKSCVAPSVKKDRKWQSTRSAAKKSTNRVARKVAQTPKIRYAAPTGTRATVKITISRGGVKRTINVKNVKPGQAVKFSKTQKKQLIKLVSRSKSLYKVTVVVTPAGDKVAKTTRTYYFYTK